MKDWLKSLFGDNFEHVRQPEVAGHQYPGEAEELGEAVESLLEAAEGRSNDAARGLIAPYGDFAYAGPTMAEAWSAVRGRDDVGRVVLLGSSGRVPFRGLALGSFDAFATPLGPVGVDLEALEAVVDREHVRPIDAAFEAAANLELQLPFVQVAAPEARVVPMLVGDAESRTVARVVDALWDEGTLVVVSGNLSEGFSRERAEELDAETCRLLVEGGDEAAGTIGRQRTAARLPIRGLLEAVGRQGREGWRLGCRGRATSADAGGPAAQVVGYGAFEVVEAG